MRALCQQAVQLHRASSKLGFACRLEQCSELCRLPRQSSETESCCLQPKLSFCRGPVAGSVNHVQEMVHRQAASRHGYPAPEPSACKGAGLAGMLSRREVHSDSLRPNCCCPGLGLSACSRERAGSESVFGRHGRVCPLVLSACSRAGAGPLAPGAEVQGSQQAPTVSKCILNPADKLLW